jgi:hypothetical protein
VIFFIKRVCAPYSFLLFFFTVSFLYPSPAVSQNGFTSSKKTLTALLIRSPIILDGFLSEKAWKDAKPISDFIQRELEEGSPATEKTEVRVLYDTMNLYIGAMCYDSEPDKILHTEMNRDSALTGDDSFTLVIDTFHDKRNGYYFSTNPNGVLNDALVSNGTSDSNWNGVWDVAVQITDLGWSVEMVLPFKTLRFPPDENLDWRIDFRRIIQRKREEVLWTAWERNDGILQLSKFGTLTGMASIKRSQQIDFKPYALAGLQKIAGVKLDRNYKYGLDMKFPVTSRITLDLTTHTDFAQVESDREQINLTRFDLNYPEKREFFLEGADIFTFASPVTTPFYSRRIGLTPDRKQVPILGGAKLIGKAGSYSIGVIDMQTDSEDSIPSTNYSVIRVKKDVLEKSYIGFIVTDASFNGGHTSQAYGADFLYRTDRFMKKQNLEIGGYLAENRIPGVDTGNHAGRIFMNLPNDTYNISLLHHAVGANYTPETGFVQRRNIKQYKASYAYTPRPGIPGVKKLLFMPMSINYYTDTGTRLLTRTMQIKPFGIQFNSGDTIELNAYGDYEHVDTAFQRFNGKLKVPTGIYNFWDYECIFSSSGSRPYFFGGDVRNGDFYNGKRKYFSSNCGFRFSKYSSISADATYQRFSIAGNTFDVRDYGGSVMLNLSPRLNSNTLVQFNNETGQVNVNFRLHYIPSIGSDVYFVYNHLWDEENDFRTLQNTGIFKIDYMFRM